MLDTSNNVRGRILFADDDPFYRELAKAALIEADFDVIDVPGGAEAIAAVDRETFDLAVLDLSMPVVSGFDVIEHIRVVRKNVNLPILVITGHDDAESVSRAFEMGAKSFLAKPLNWLLFVHHVQFVLKSARTQHDLQDMSRMADLVNSVKTRLIGTLITEFQTPLRTAYGFSKLLQREADGPIESTLYKAWIQDLHKALENLSVTHAKMLNFGRMLADGVQLNEDVVSVASILSSVLAAVQEQARRRNIAIDVMNNLPAPLQMRVDSALLSQALKAVIENAVKFSTRGSNVTVTLYLNASRDLFIAIDDTSNGLSRSLVDDIMGTGATAPGAGIDGVERATGLKMSRVLFEAHQGGLVVHSMTGEGTRVELRLPAARLTSDANKAIDQNQSNLIGNLHGTRSSVDGPATYQ
jgi:signal transduction histidine kinase